METKKSTIRLKVIKPTYETLTIKEAELPIYLRQRKRITSSSDVYLLFGHLMQSPREVFLALHLDSKSRIICVDTVSQGSLNASVVHPREVFSSAILSASAAMILVHQHPSGDPEPSKEDIEISKRIKEGGELLGIRVLDSVIIGDGEYVSLADRGTI